VTAHHASSSLEEGTGAQATLASILAAAVDPERSTAAWKLIDEAQSIVLLAHERPDPDALGSALGLAHVLSPLGKECVVACADPVPANYASFLPGSEAVVLELPHERFDLVIALDAGELSRYGALYTRYQRFFDHATILNLDHHTTSSGCGKVTIIDSESAATAELLTLFLLSGNLAISPDAAECLLAGIITDTRAFEFDATTERTLLAGAYLVGCGAVPEKIIKPFYRMKPLAKAGLWGIVLDRSLRSTAEGRIVWACVRTEYLKEAGATSDMDDGLVNYLVDVDGVAFAVLFAEVSTTTTKLSIRTVAPYDAAAIASHFGGGGHVRAAGVTVPLAVEAAVNAVIAYIEATLTPNA
jgi:bifunctional oligoribonuclease and PAP phosphatase NrnA